jgi:hypothetical protein
MALGLVIRQAAAINGARRTPIRPAGYGNGDAQGRGPAGGGQFGSLATIC